MSKKEDFKHYMLAGHGRAASLLNNDKEELREIVLYGCLNDISFDMQCEGSRGRFMHNLAMQYEDYDYFLKPAVEKFLSPEVNSDWRSVCHLCDFIRGFADENNNEAAYIAICRKYDALYWLIMSDKGSSDKNILQSFEYLAIVLMQMENFVQTLKTFRDIGSYFVKNKQIPDDELKWDFAWFYSEAEELYGEEFLKAQLGIHRNDYREIARFADVISKMQKEFTVRKKPALTADEFIAIAEKLNVKRSDVISFMRADNDEKVKLANAVTAEPDLNKKAELLSAFTVSRNPFPLDPSIVVECAGSENDSLRNAAMRAMTYIRADCVRDYALGLLEKGDSPYAFDVLTRNYRDSDKELILDRLGSLEIGLDDKYNWHSAVRGILNEADEFEIPSELLMFVYEKSLCSCCRENAFGKLKERNALTDEMISECLHDANSDIRREAESLSATLKSTKNGL